MRLPPLGSGACPSLLMATACCSLATGKAPARRSPAWGALQPSSEPAWRVGIYPPCKLKILCVSQAHGEKRKSSTPPLFIQVGPLRTVHTVVCSPTYRLHPIHTRSPHPRYRLLRTCVSLSPSRGHTRISWLWLCTQHCSSCSADRSGLAGPGQRHGWFLFTKELSVAAPAYPTSITRPRPAAGQGETLASYPHQHWRGQNEWFPQRNPPWSGTLRAKLA